MGTAYKLVQKQTSNTGLKLLDDFATKKRGEEKTAEVPEEVP